MEVTTEWRRVSKQHPCPICSKPDYCTTNGAVAHCMRVPSDHPQKDGQGWIHRLGDSLAAQFPAPIEKQRPRPTDEQLDKTFARLAKQWYERGAAKRVELARLLGVAQWTMEALRVGWNGTTWTVPECAPSGLVVGIGTRYPDGAKKFIAGGRRGLVWDRREIAAQAAVLIVEGPSDVAAGMTMGLTVIGRPSNNGGAGNLADLLRNVAGRLVVLGENDKKPDGRWPGKEGAISVQNILAKRLHRPVLVRFPPDGAKDLRKWLNAQVADPEECANAGSRFLNAIH